MCVSCLLGGKPELSSPLCSLTMQHHTVTDNFIMLCVRTRVLRVVLRYWPGKAAGCCGWYPVCIYDLASSAMHSAPLNGIVLDASIAAWMRYQT